MAEGPWPGEMLTAPDGRWLGAFDSEYVVPVDSTRFSLRFPVGWTNGTWYELRGCNLHYQGCACSDCHGLQYGFLFDQRYPGDTLDPCWTSRSLDGWAVSISPKICQEGCGNCIGPGGCFSEGGSDSVQCGHSCGGDEDPVGWPLVMFGGTNPSADIRVVTDATGPTGLEDMKAMRIDFSGSGAEGATFVGEDGGHDAGRPPFTDSGPAYDWTGVRYSTGITFVPGECYRFACWVKAVPDRYGHTCTGYEFQVVTKYGTVIQPFFDGGHGTVTLDGTWQYLTGEFTFDFLDEPVHNAPIFLQTLNSNTTDDPELCEGDNPTFPDRTVTKPRGRVHVKAAHLGPCKPQPVHVWRWH